MRNKQIFDIPILFLVFNRPEHTLKVFEKLREIKPSKLFIGSDGPRENNISDFNLIKKVRKIVDSIDWDCEVHKLYRNHNLGCKQSVSGAITWFFDRVEMGIILEDDCLPCNDFFFYSKSLLEKYKSNPKIFAISGTNLTKCDLTSSSSYYFSKVNHVWGWATWKRAWDLYDNDLSFWPFYKQGKGWKEFWKNKKFRKYWEKLFDLTFENKIDTWDYQWLATIMKYGGLSITPRVNLVSNIGFGSEATHTKRIDSPISELPINSILPLFHPETITYSEICDNKLHREILLNENIPQLVNKLKSFLSKIYKWAT